MHLKSLLLRAFRCIHDWCTDFFSWLLFSAFKGRAAVTATIECSQVTVNLSKDFERRVRMSV